MMDTICDHNKRATLFERKKIHMVEKSYRINTRDAKFRKLWLTPFFFKFLGGGGVASAQFFVVKFEMSMPVNMG